MISRVWLMQVQQQLQQLQQQQLRRWFEISKSLESRKWLFRNSAKIGTIPKPEKISDSRFLISAEEERKNLNPFCMSSVRKKDLVFLSHLNPGHCHSILTATRWITSVAKLAFWMDLGRKWNSRWSCGTVVTSWTRSPWFDTNLSQLACHLLALDGFYQHFQATVHFSLTRAIDLP